MPEIRELLERIDDLLSDAVSAHWIDDSPIPKIEEAQRLIEEALRELAPVGQ
jgi:hypothetical protein